MYNDIKAITNEEVFEYLKLYKEGKVEYRDKIIIGYIPLVKYCVYKYFYTSIGKNISYSYNNRASRPAAPFLSARPQPAPPCFSARCA